VNESDASRDRGLDVADHGARAVDQDLARVRLQDAAHDLHQRRLAGAVFAQQRQHLAGVQLEAHAFQRVNSRKALVDRAKLEERPAHAAAAAP
jgi:hypothetical protein